MYFRVNDMSQNELNKEMKPCGDCGTPIPTIFFSQIYQIGLCRVCWEKRELHRLKEITDTKTNKNV